MYLYLKRIEMINISKVGISTACYYPENTFVSLQNVLDTGVPVAEVFMNSLEELEPSNLKRFTDEASAHGAEIVSFHPYTSAFESLLFFSEYKLRLCDGIELYKRFFEAARILGAKYFVFHGEKNSPTFSRSLSSREHICEVYGRLIEAARKEGLTFTQENVNNFRSHSPEYIKYLYDTIPELCFTFDLKQALRARQDHIAIVDAMGERMKHIHINDFGEHECCLPFEGYVNMNELSAKLNEHSYSGDFILEVYRANFEGTKDLVNSLEKVKKTFCKGEIL